MDIRIDEQGEIVRIAVTGSVDDAGADKLENCFTELCGCHVREVVLDFRGVTFISSSGIGKLLLLYKKVTPMDVSITLEKLPPDLLRAFKVTRLDALFNMSSA